MRISLLSVVVLGLGALAPAQGQDILYYPFLTGSGTTVTNLYGASGPAPSTGNLVNTNTTNAGWASGVSGGYSLAGKDAAGTLNYLDSGWNGAHTGSFTVAFFAKESWTQTSANALAYVFSGVGSFRMFTGGVAYEAFYIRNWGGADIILPGTTNQNGGFSYDFRAEAKKGWVHVACRVAESTDTATWFINGTPLWQQSLSGGKVSVPASTTNNFRVGMHTSTGSGFNYDVDDFRFTGREVPDHEIQAWAMAKLIADRTELSISGTGAARTQNLSLDVGSSTALNNYWIFGTVTGVYPGVNLLGFNVPLNFDPYTTIVMTATNSPTFSGFRGVAVNGKAKASFNLPANTPASAIGEELHHAAVIYDVSTGAWRDVTNAATARIVK